MVSGTCVEAETVRAEVCDEKKIHAQTRGMIFVIWNPLPSKSLTCSSSLSILPLPPSSPSPSLLPIPLPPPHPLSSPALPSSFSLPPPNPFSSPHSLLPPPHPPSPSQPPLPHPPHLLSLTFPTITLPTPTPPHISSLPFSSPFPLQGIEFFCGNGQTLFLVLPSLHQRYSLYQQILAQPNVRLEEIDLEATTLKWQTEEMSNYDYLMFLNL